MPIIPNVKNNQQSVSLPGNYSGPKQDFRDNPTDNLVKEGISLYLDDDLEGSFKKFGEARRTNDEIPSRIYDERQIDLMLETNESELIGLGKRGIEPEQLLASK